MTDLAQILGVNGMIQILWNKMEHGATAMDQDQNQSRMMTIYMMSTWPGTNSAQHRRTSSFRASSNHLHATPHPIVFIPLKMN